MVTRLVDRYAIYLADLDPTRGREIAKTRPVVVVSLDEMNRHLDTVVVCPLTTKLHPRWRSRLQVICAGRRADFLPTAEAFPGGVLTYGCFTPAPPRDNIVALGWLMP